MMTITSRTRRTSFRLGGALLLALAAGAAYAADAPQVTVSYQDLDPTRLADARVLYARLRHAADSVCHASVVSGGLAQRAIYKRCYAGALESAVRQVNVPQVLALYNADSANGRQS